MTRSHTTRVIFTVKICIFERSNEKSHFSKTKIYFHKKPAPQLSGHIVLQTMKVRVKTNLIVLASFVSREEITVDEQLSEAGTNSSACRWYKARLLSKDKRNSNLLFPAVDSRHFVGTWAKINEINQSKKQACGAVVALALS